MRKWLTADQHFGHANMIPYENRPFADVEEMDAYMIKQWNSVVNKKDIVYHLGDFSFYNQERTAEILSELKGRKWLILGNHDRSNVQWHLDAGFEKVYDTTIIIQEFAILSHKPVYLRKIGPFINIHGHLHSTSMNHENYFNVGVENNDYMPFNMEDIISAVVKMRSLEFATERIHH